MTDYKETDRGLPSALPSGKAPESYLPDETPSMDDTQRKLEQQGHRRFAKVHEREHHEKPSYSPEGELQNSIQQHPWLDKPRFDGIDPNVSPVPPLNSEARREFDNALRLQLQKKNELQHSNTNTNTIKPPRP